MPNNTNSSKPTTTSPQKPLGALTRNERHAQATAWAVPGKALKRNSVLAPRTGGDEQWEFYFKMRAGQLPGTPEWSESVHEDFTKDDDAL